MYCIHIKYIQIKTILLYVLMNPRVLYIWVISITKLRKIMTIKSIIIFRQ